jgi:hypothetical protein
MFNCKKTIQFLLYKKYMKSKSNYLLLVAEDACPLFREYFHSLHLLRLPTANILFVVAELDMLPQLHVVAVFQLEHIVVVAEVVVHADLDSFVGDIVTVVVTVTVIVAVDVIADTDMVVDAAVVAAAVAVRRHHHHPSFAAAVAQRHSPVGIHLQRHHSRYKRH